MTQAKFSIIIPCYNVAPFLPRLIAGLQAQTLPDCEFIFVNDASKDNTLELLQEFARQDDRVVLIDKVNEGVSVARNVALDVATGEYVYILDGDDWMEPTWCEEMYSLVKEDDIDILVFNYYKAYDDRKVYVDLGIKEGVYTQQEFLYELKALPLSHMLYKRDTIAHLRFKPEVRVGEVFTFFVGALAHAKRVKVTNKCFWNYYHNAESATQKPKPAADLTIVNALHALDEYAANYPKNLKTYPCFVITVCRLMNAFTFNKYVKHTASYSTMRTIITQVYKSPIAREYLSLYVKLTPLTHLKRYYMQALASAPYLCYFLLYPIFKVRNCGK